MPFTRYHDSNVQLLEEVFRQSGEAEISLHNVSLQQVDTRSPSHQLASPSQEVLPLIETC